MKSTQLGLHPLAVAATALLIVNDHVLKGVYGNWLTGKLSDVAFLVVAPVVVAALLTMVRVPRASLLSSFAVGLAFITLQLWPPLGDAWCAVMGGAHTPDLTDLFVLPALALAPLCMRPGPRVPMVLPVAALGCVATSWALLHSHRLPLDGAEDWDPNLPLIYVSDVGLPDVPALFEPFSLELDGEPVDIVLATAARTVVVCVPGGLEPETTYIWRLRQPDNDSTHHLPVPQFELAGRRVFTTAASSVMDSFDTVEDCQAWADTYANDNLHVGAEDSSDERDVNYP